jgi:hypothetical protein
MFIFMHYSGPEPKWAESLRGMVPAYSPAYPFGAQEESLSEHLEGKEPAARATEFKAAFQLDESIWKPLSEVTENLVGADSLTSTDHFVWRDQWLLSRADVVIVDSAATTEIPLLAALWGIPVIAVSFSPTGMSPWLSKTAQVTVNSPTGAEQILSVLGIRTATAEEQAEAQQAAQAEGATGAKVVTGEIVE